MKLNLTVTSAIVTFSFTFLLFTCNFLRISFGSYGCSSICMLTIRTVEHLLLAVISTQFLALTLACLYKTKIE